MRFIKKSFGSPISFFFILFAAFSMASADPAQIPSDPGGLKEAINRKNQELQKIHQEIEENRKNLKEIQGQKQTLQREIKSIDGNIREVTLSISASEATIEQLGLEVEYLNYIIGESEKKINEKEKVITKIMQELQEKEAESPLIILLRNKSLADTVLETQNLMDLNQNLKAEISNLRSAKNELAAEVYEKSSKKSRAEFERANLKNKKLILADVREEKNQIFNETKNREYNYQKSLNELEKRQAEIAAEVEKLEKELRAKIDPSLLPSKRAGILTMPASGILSQDYGATTFAKFGYRGKWHNGIDIAAPFGAPVLSAERGKVISVGDQDRYCPRGAYGKFIVIQHENNLTTLYAHLSLQIVKEGNIVEKGALIGYIGKTGYATGPHLHFGVYASQTFRIGPSMVCGPKMPYGGDLNPMDYL